MEVIESLESGVKDKFTVTLTDPAGGLLYSSNWNGIKSIVQEIANGKIYVRGNVTPVPATSVNTINKIIPETLVAKFQLKAFPNPSNSQFAIKIESNDTHTPISAKVFDNLGRIVEVKQKLSAGQTIQLAETYRPGIYIIEITQGCERRQLKLVKQVD
ncbi:MAG: T9SS type A sorting domain-containing protein [Chitinophagaceae bacterium]|nr:T9SS type A sorting domain-containing protein [Chitinophagaceae bacterium]